MQSGLLNQGESVQMDLGRMGFGLLYELMCVLHMGCMVFEDRLLNQV